MLACVGGTFSEVHTGHLALLKKSLEVAGDGGALIIGLTTNDKATTDRPNTTIKPYLLRKAMVTATLDQLMAELSIKVTCSFVPLSDYGGSASRSPTLEAIIVSSETRSVADKINWERKDRYWNELEIFEVPMVTDDAGEIVSSSRIRSGEVSTDGKAIHDEKETSDHQTAYDIQIIAGTMNQAKIAGIQAGAESYLDGFFVSTTRTDLEISGPVPIGDQVNEMALKRATLVQETHKDEPGPLYLYVGVEAGLIKAEDKWSLVHDCVVMDGKDNIGSARSSELVLPPSLSYLLDKDDKAVAGIELEDIVHEIYGISEIGRNEGLVGLLTGGAITRKDIVKDVLILACTYWYENGGWRTMNDHWTRKD